MKVLLMAFGGAGLFRYGVVFSKVVEKVGADEIVILASDHDVVGSADLIAALKLRARLIAINTRDPAGLFVAVYRCIRLLWGWRPDIVHDLAGPASRSTWWLWLVSKAFSKLVITLHDPKAHSGMRKVSISLRTKVCGKLANSVLVHGSHTASLAANFGINKKKLTIIPHVELSIFEKINEQFGSPCRWNELGQNYVLLFGAIRPNKGIELLPRIAHSAWKVNPDIRFVVAGELPPRNSISAKNWIERVYGVKENICKDIRVTWIDDFVPDAEVAPLFHNASLVLLPYTDATQSGVLMMAFGMGVPVLTTDVGDFPETIENNRTGRVVVCDAEKIGVAVAEMVMAPMLRTRLGRTARTHAMTMFSPVPVAKLVRSVYESVLCSQK